MLLSTVVEVIVFLYCFLAHWTSSEPFMYSDLLSYRIVCARWWVMSFLYQLHLFEQYPWSVQPSKNLLQWMVIVFRGMNNLKNTPNNMRNLISNWPIGIIFKWIISKHQWTQSPPNFRCFHLPACDLFSTALAHFRYLNAANLKRLENAKRKKTTINLIVGFASKRRLFQARREQRKCVRRVRVNSIYFSQ